MIKTRLSDKNDLNDESINRIFELINDAYDEAEAGMWKFKGGRVSKKGVKSLLENQTLILAENNNQIVGSVKIRRHDDDTGEFGMLVSDQKLRGQGIGVALVNAAEQWARKNNYKIMRLELLTPRHWHHPSKEFLKKWYSRMAYQPNKTVEFNMADGLATECDFTVWLKNLN